MAEIASESWWIKLGVMYDKSGFKAAIVGMTDLKRIAGGLADTFKRVVDSNTDLYRTAHNLNMSTRDLQVWQRVFKMVHGTVEEARADINNLNYAYDELLLGMGGAKAEAAARLHLSPADLVDFESAMKALNRAFNTEFGGNIGIFRPLAQQIGLSETAINLVTQSVSEYERRVKDASNIPVIPNRQLKAASDLYEQFTKLSIKWENFKASLVSASFPALSKLMGDIDKVMSNPQVTKSIGKLLELLEVKFNELVQGDSVARFFDQLEQGISKVVTNENLDRFLTVMNVLIKGVDYGIVKPIQFAGKGYGAVLSEVGTVQGEIESGRGVDWRHRVSPFIPAFSAAVPGAGAVQGITKVFNMTFNGVPDAQTLSKEYENVLRKQDADQVEANAGY